MQNKNIQTLKTLGLTTYEALAYLTLNSLIKAKATQISEESTIPRSKVYDVLKNLQKKGYIEIEHGRPIIYHAIPAKEIFEKEKTRIIQNINTTQQELTEIYENQISQVPAPIWLIHGTEKALKKELDIIKRTQNTLNMRIGYLLPQEETQLTQALKKIEHKTTINILISPRCLKNTQDNLITKLKNTNINIQKTKLPLAKMMIKDNKELLHIFTKFTDTQTPIPNTTIGIWNRYENIAQNYNKRFYNALEKKEKGNNKK